MNATPALIRCMEKVDKSDDPDGCWLWIGAKSGGRGSIRVAGRSLLAYRVLYELLVGPIPEGLELDHLCRVPLCVNPAHLEPVTHAENMRRGFGAPHFQRSKTHCPYGHPYDDENTVLTRSGKRDCRICRRRHGREAMQRQRDRKKASGDV